MSTAATTADRTSLDRKTLSARRAELISLRAAQSDGVEQLTDTAAGLVDDGAPERTDEEGFGEAGTLDVERERLLALAATAARRVDEIDAALARLESGTYGTCERCDQPIAPARLEALPEATLCVACKSSTPLGRSTRRAG